MSFGLICACDDTRHPIDPRSVRGELAVWCRCRNYAVDDEEGGLCAPCAAAAHKAAPPERRDLQQRWSTPDPSTSPRATTNRAAQSHVNADGRPKRVFETELAATIEVQRLGIQQGLRFDWYVCSQRPQHWHLAKIRGGAR